MRYVRRYLTAIVPWISLLALTACKGVLQWTSAFDTAHITNVRVIGKAPGTYSTGTVTIRAEFSERIFINTSNGNPSLTLNTSPNQAQADFTNCSTVTLGAETKYVCDFEYVIRANENTALLDYDSINALNLNGATIVDEDGDNIDTTLPLAGSGNSIAQSNIAIDTAGPTVTKISAVSVPSNRTFTSNQTVKILVTFSEAISFTGTPTLQLNSGTTLSHDPNFDPGFALAANELIFAYIVSSGDTAVDPLDVDSDSALVGAIEDAYGNTASLDLAGLSTENSLSHSNVNIAPSTPAGPPYIVSVRASNPTPLTIGTGESAHIRVIFDRNLQIAGGTNTFYINMNADLANNSEASFVSYGANSSELIFRYTASSGHSTDSLNYQSISSWPTNIDPQIQIVSGRIEDANSPNAPAELILPSDLDPTSLIQSYSATRYNNTIKVVPYTRPGAVNNFSVGFVGHETPYDTSDDYALKLSWNTPSVGTPTNYIIRRSVDGGAYSDISNSSAMSEYMDTDVVLGKNYTYEIRAVTDELPSNVVTSASASLEPVVIPTYGEYGYGWNDYVATASSASGMTLDESTSLSLTTTSPVPTSTACSPGSMNTYRDCVHGGERRKIILYGITQAQCNDGAIVNEYVGSTALNIFEWSPCIWVDNSSMVTPVTGTNPPSNVAVVFANGFKEGKGLRDLIDFNANPVGWKEIFAKVTVGGKTYNTPIYNWWNNQFEELADNSGSTHSVLTLSTAKKIYYYKTSRTTAGYYLGADKISVVGPSNATLTWNSLAGANSNTTGALGGLYKSILLGNKDHIWIEAKLDAISSGDNGVFLGVSRASRIHNTSATNANTSGIYLASTKASSFTNYSSARTGVGIFALSIIGNLFKRVQITDTPLGQCIFAASPSKNSFTSISTSNCKSHGIEISGGDNNNFSQIVSANNLNNGILISGTNNTLTALTLTNNKEAGLKLNNATNSIVHSLLAGNNGTGSNSALVISGSNSRYITLSQLAFARNTTSNTILKIENGAKNIKFTGGFIKEDSADCSRSGSGEYPGIETDCSIQFTADNAESIYPLGDIKASNHNLVNINDGDITFFSTNGDPNDAYAGSSFSAYSSTTGTSMLTSLVGSGYHNLFKSWGVTSATTSNSIPNWPSSSFLGNCHSLTCIVSDWRLTSSSSGANPVVRNTTGDATNENEDPSSTCPEEVENANFQTDTSNGSILQTHSYPDNNTYLGGLNGESLGGSLSAQKFHKVAIEIIGDSSGDEDGLCENGETCLYMPNFGAYQGHESASSCTTNNTVIKSSSSKMFYYQTNGVN